MRDECAVKYNMNSKRAEEFIHHQEILDTLEYAQANRNNRRLIESLIEKAGLCGDSRIGRLPCYWSVTNPT